MSTQHNRGGTLPAMCDGSAPYVLTWWSATGRGDESTFNRRQFDDLVEAELALDGVRRDLANDLIGCNWPAPAIDDPRQAPGHHVEHAGDAGEQEDRGQRELDRMGNVADVQGCR